MFICNAIINAKVCLRVDRCSTLNKSNRCSLFVQSSRQSSVGFGGVVIRPALRVRISLIRNVSCSKLSAKRRGFGDAVIRPVFSVRISFVGQSFLGVDFQRYGRYESLVSRGTTHTFY